MNALHRAQAAADLIGRYVTVVREAWRHEAADKTPRRTAREAEFLPAALALQASPVSPAGRWVARILMLIVVSTLAWSFFSRVDIVTVGQGKVAVNGESKTISSTQVASVRVLHVTENQQVRAGQLLIELDNREVDSELEKAEGERQAAAVQVAVQTALIDALNTGRAPRLPALAELSAQRRQEAEQSLSSAWNDYAARRDHLTTDIARFTGALPIAVDREREYAELARTRDVAQDAFLQRKMTRIELEGQLSQARSQLRELTATTRKQADDRLAEAARVTQASRQDVLKAAARQSLLQLRSPVDGTVQQLTTHTVGAAIPAAQPLMQIVPLNSRVQFEAFIENRDVGFVREGQEVAVKIDAFDYTRYGTVPGRVDHVSRDALQDEKRGPIYAVTVTLDQTALDVEGRRMPIGPGMSGTVDIRTGTRRVIDYLLSPLIQHQRESLRER